MSLNVVMITVRDKASGKEQSADLAKCTCGHGAFSVFQVHGYSHIHMQCTDCARVYCPESDRCASKTSPESARETPQA